MLDVGWAELLVIGVVALIVIGPKDLPEMFRQLGRFTAKLRSMAREFQRAMDQAAKESGVKDIAKDLKAVTSAKAMGLDAMKGAVDRFEKWDPIKNAAKPTTTAKPLVPAAMPATPLKVDPVVPAPLGPATQALADNQAAKKAILQDTAKKLKSVGEKLKSVSQTPAAKAPRQPLVKTAAPVAEVAPLAKPRKSRKASEA